MNLDRLLGFLEQDPDNLSLLAAAANAAFTAGDTGLVRRLAARHETIAPLPPELLNLAGIAALREGDLDAAQAAFEALLAAGIAGPEALFNLAWTRATQGDWQGARDLIDAETAATIPHAAALKVQALHHLGDPEDALAWGLGVAERRPDDGDLIAALAVAAMDAESPDLARSLAERAGDRHEGLATLGLLQLDGADPDGAVEYFDRALTARPDSGRALLGKGLALLAQGDAAQAAGLLDQGAEVFGDHLGSWVASGWAYFIQGDHAESRRRFETAMALDDTFAETHGGLAVLDIAAGDLEQARRRADIALRLDRACLSGVLARTLLLDQAGDHATAARLREIALNTAISPDGKTLAQVVAGYAARSTGGRGAA